MSKKYLLMLLITTVLLVSCITVKKVEYEPVNNKNENYTDRKKILILYHGTEFRDESVSGLKEKLLADDITVIVDDASKGKNYDPGFYDIVVVFSGIHAFIPDAYPNDYIFKHKNEKNIIKVFYTYLTKKGITVRTGIKNKVDTITAASMDSNKDGLVEEIYKLIMEKMTVYE